MNDIEMNKRLAACAAFADGMTQAQKTLVAQIDSATETGFNAQQVRANLNARESHVILPASADKKDLAVALKYLDLITDPTFTIILHQDDVVGAMTRQPVDRIISTAQTERFLQGRARPSRNNAPKP